MTKAHTARLYALAASVLVLFLAWAAVAARPWKTQAAPRTSDPRLVALDRREQLLRQDIALVQRIAARAQARRAQASQLAAAAPAPAAAPRVRIVTLPPQVITRTS